MAEALLLDDDTVRDWYKAYVEDGIEGLTCFDYKGRACYLNEGQQEQLKAWIGETLPRTTRAIGAWIEEAFGIAYGGRSGLIALLHRLGMEHRKPQVIASKLDEAKQQAFIEEYNALLNRMADHDDEVMLFGDAVHPTHAVRSAGCWTPKEMPVAVTQASGRDRLNIHGAIDLETGKTFMVDALTVNAASTIALFSLIEGRYPHKKKIHIWVDQARYHHAVLVDEWLARPTCRIILHFIPTYCPHLNPIERLWGLMHKHVTYNKCYAKFNDFCNAILHFLRVEVPQNWRTFSDTVSDNFRIIAPQNFRLLS